MQDSIADREFIPGEPWRHLVDEAQQVVAELCPNSYYEQAYRAAEASYWTHVPRWIYLDNAANPFARCLDVGCAYGTLLVYTRILSGCEAYGIDFVPAYMGDALRSAYDLRFAVRNVELDPIPWDVTFDAIILTEVVEHFCFSAVPTLRKLRAHLAKAGRVYLSTPDAAEWGRQLRYYQSYADVPIPDPTMRDRVVDDHVWHFNRDELFDVVAEAGFEVRRFDYAAGIGARHFNLTLAPDSSP